MINIISIRWPGTDKIQFVENVAANSLITITEDDDKVETTKFKEFELSNTIE